jgi:uncharacterized protein YjbI with pentapeptide repeats
MRGADLAQANLHQAKLTGADMTGGFLTFARLDTSDLDGLNWTDATMGHTLLAHVDLSTAMGLHRVHHIGSSLIDIDNHLLPQQKA